MVDEQIVPFMRLSKHGELALLSGGGPRIPVVIGGGATPPELQQFLDGLIGGLQSLAKGGANLPSAGALSIGEAGSALGRALGAAGTNFAQTLSKNVQSQPDAWRKDPVGQFHKLVRDFSFEGIF